jgi:DNA-binding MarR family transcriptional regulator
MLAPTGLRINQYAVLSTLSRLGEVPLTELAHALDLDQTSATRSIASLEQMGLVERANHHDSRVKLLRLTNSGKQRFKTAKSIWKETQEKMLDRISEKEWAAFMKTLQKLKVSP